MPSREGMGPDAGVGLGQGQGYRRGPVKNFIKERKVEKTQSELLQEQKELLELLESKLDVISKQLESLVPTK